MKFIVIEGLDGAGKSTQLNLLREQLSSMGKKFFYLHFPRTDSPVFGELVARFLRGEFGSNEDVDPYLVALLFAGDRNDAAPRIRAELEKGHYVILDRYVYSNIAYQCAKLKSNTEKDKLRDWILEMEYGYYNIPRPDLNLFLDVPSRFTKNNLSLGREGADRDYLEGKSDIHEASLDFQKEVREIYLNRSKEDKSLKIINCSGEAGNMLPPGDIYKKIVSKLEEENIL